jgi:hypothetical protein
VEGNDCRINSKMNANLWRKYKKIFHIHRRRIKDNSQITSIIQVFVKPKDTCCFKELTLQFILLLCAGAKARHSTEIRQTIPYTPYNHSWTVPLAPFLPYPLPFGIRPEFTWLAVDTCFITLHPGSELGASNSGLGLYIKILFRQGWQQSLVLLRLEVL